MCIRDREISTYFLKRGIIIILIHLFIEGPAWLMGILSNANFGMEASSGTGMPAILNFAVLFSLGMSMILMGLLIHLRSHWICLISLLALFIPQFIIPTEAADTYQAAWERIFYIPGKTGYLFVLYPIAPWIGITGLGVLFGRLVLKNLQLAYNLSLGIGVGLVASFIAIRLLCLLYTSPSPRDLSTSRMPSSA